MSHVYLQLWLNEASQKYATINIHKGLYQYTRLPFGVSSACAIFQQTMENIFQGLPQIIIYLDDVLITGSTNKEHFKNLDIVLRHFPEEQKQKLLEKLSRSVSICEEKVRVNVLGPVTLLQNSLSKVLAHYDVKQDLVLTRNASPYGIRV
eukprot:g32919.t1